MPNGFVQKQRLTEMRRAGHAWGDREADRATTEVDMLTPAKAARFIAKSIRERTAALRSIGATDEEVEAWASCCRKQFNSRLRL